MDMLQLKLFISVSQTLNFTKTASEFYMAQPTVSNHIKSLENDVGVRLLNRDSRNVSLTPEGQEFVDYASRILTIQLEAENRLHNISKGRRGFIKIAMLSSTAELFSDCLTEVSKRLPDVQVDVDMLEGAEMSRALSLLSYDVYFANHYMLPDSDSIEYAIIGTDPLHLFVHKAMADNIDMNDWSTLEKYHFVSVPEMGFSLSRQIKTICKNRGITPDIINYYNRADTLLLAVNSGIGMTILPPGATYYYNFPNIVSLPIEGEDAKITAVVAWGKKEITEDAKRFLQLRPLIRYLYGRMP